MRRREFITLLGGAAAAWPRVSRAQQADRARRVGILLPANADVAQFQAWVGAFLQALAPLGWSVDRNVRIDIHWATTNAAEIRRHAAELAALSPDVILAFGTSTVGPLLQATRSVPIVFPGASDPVAAGLVDSLARPGGNATGFLSFEYGISGKWLELLKEVAPGVTRVGVLRDPATPTGSAMFGVIQALAPSLRVEVNPVNIRDAGEIERTVATFARSALTSGASGQRGDSILRAPDTRPESGSSARASNGGLIVTPGNTAEVHRNLIVTLAARHKLPAVYTERHFAAAGGLISYGPDRIDAFRRAAGYVDRILRGEKPADLPVQAPTKYETVINLKSAKALGLAVPLSLQQRADEVIE